ASPAVMTFQPVPAVAVLNNVPLISDAVRLLVVSRQAGDAFNGGDPAAIVAIVSAQYRLIDGLIWPGGKVKEAVSWVGSTVVGGGGVKCPVDRPRLQWDAVVAVGGHQAIDVARHHLGRLPSHLFRSAARLNGLVGVTEAVL